MKVQGILFTLLHASAVLRSAHARLDPVDIEDFEMEDCLERNCGIVAAMLKASAVVSAAEEESIATDDCATTRCKKSLRMSPPKMKTCLRKKCGYISYDEESVADFLDHNSACVARCKKNRFS